MMKYSPGPWKLRNGAPVYPVPGPKERWKKLPRTEANFERIVTCANFFDEMMFALKSSKAALIKAGLPFEHIDDLIARIEKR